MAEIDTKQQTHEDGVPTQRRKLHLKPRDPEAAARIEAERAQSLGKVSVSVVNEFVCVLLSRNANVCIHR